MSPACQWTLYWIISMSIELETCLFTRAGLHLRDSALLLKHWHLFSCRFVCCVMVTIPLAATLLTAIIRWKRNREVSPSLESSSINTGLNLYGTLKSNGSSGSDRNSGTSEEKGKFTGTCCKPWLQDHQTIDNDKVLILLKTLLNSYTLF